VPSLLEGTVTNHSRNADDPIPEPLDPDDIDAADDPDDWVEAVFIERPHGSTAHHLRDPYDLGWLFLRLSWEARYRHRKDGLRALARALRAFERIGFIERRTIRRPGRPTHHGFIITDEGRDAVGALSGDWIGGQQR
jgi:hypothetical protein